MNLSIKRGEIFLAKFSLIHVRYYFKSFEGINLFIIKQNIFLIIS